MKCDQRPLIVANVLEHVEAHDRIELSEFRSELFCIALHSGYARVTREPLAQELYEAIFGFERDHLIGETSDHFGERSRSRARVEHAPTNVRSCAIDDPRGVVAAGFDLFENVIEVGRVFAFAHAC